MKLEIEHFNDMKKQEFKAIPEIIKDKHIRLGINLNEHAKNNGDSIKELYSPSPKRFYNFWNFNYKNVQKYYNKDIHDTLGFCSAIGAALLMLPMIPWGVAMDVANKKGIHLFEVDFFFMTIVMSVFLTFIPTSIILPTYLFWKRIKPGAPLRRVKLLFGSNEFYDGVGLGKKSIYISKKNEEGRNTLTNIRYKDIEKIIDVVKKNELVGIILVHKNNDTITINDVQSNKGNDLSALKEIILKKAKNLEENPDANNETLLLTNAHDLNVMPINIIQQPSAI